MYAALHHGDRFPTGVQTAENLHAHGLIDTIVTDRDLGGLVGRILEHLDGTDAGKGAHPGAPTTSPSTIRTLVGPRITAWTAVTRTRRPDRPGLRELLHHSTIAPAALSEPGRGLTLTLARFGTTSCLVVGQDRAAQTTTPIEPMDLATARRGIRLAADLGLPLITIIDTPGAGLSVAAEQAGLAQEIAHCLADLITVSTPTLSILLGQGAGGAALALLPADRVLAAQHSWLTPLPPEGASQIVHRNTRRAADITATQRCTSSDLVGIGVVDRIFPDSPDDPSGFMRSLAAVIESEIGVLVAGSTGAGRNRENRWTRLGSVR